MILPVRPPMRPSAPLAAPATFATAGPAALLTLDKPSDALLVTCVARSLVALATSEAFVVALRTEVLPRRVIEN
jgi:hypothetical protein